MDTPATLSLSPFVVTVFISLVVPIATGLVTKYALPAAAKAIIMVVLDAAVALVVGATMLPDGTAVINSQTLMSAVIAVVVSVATYMGIYVPWRLTNKPDGILGAGVGLGPKA